MNAQGLEAGSEGRPLDDTPPAWRRYGVAAVAVGLAWALTRAAPPLHQVPSTLFFAAVTLAAFYGRLGPGLLATALSTLAIDYSFMAPINSVATGLAEFVRVAAFALASALINSLHEGRRLAEVERQKSEGTNGRSWKRQHEISKWRTSSSPARWPTARTSWRASRKSSTPSTSTDS